MIARSKFMYSICKKVAKDICAVLVRDGQTTRIKLVGTLILGMPKIKETI
jgi:hypothetical protein